MAVLVHVPQPLLEILVDSAVSKQRVYRAKLARLIGASNEALEGKTPLFLISLMKLCGFAEVDMRSILRRSRVVEAGMVLHPLISEPSTGTRMSLKVVDAKQRDVGHGKVRIGNETMEKLAITVGDFIEVHGKRATVAMAWPAYAEDQGQEIVRMDGLLRRNAGVAMNEYVTIKKAEVKDSQTIVFAPTDVRLSVDEEFVGFVKRRFMDMPYVEGDMMLLSIFGSAVPLIATTTQPKSPVKIVESTDVQVMSEPIELPKDKPVVNFPQDILLTRQIQHAVTGIREIQVEIKVILGRMDALDKRLQAIEESLKKTR